jgi:hypothetical protein
MCCKFKDNSCAELAAVCCTAATCMLICNPVCAVTYVGLIWFRALRLVNEIRTLGKFPLHNRETSSIISPVFNPLYNRKIGPILSHVFFI